ncbi:DASH complex subunit Dam1-domain-containing protein [Poronia punctata]|nr:DASH complex subunit Dam1-domain-containing protein [Poronia punctata]
MADSDNTMRPRSMSRSRPTTPLRPSSRSSLRESARRSVDGRELFPLNTSEPAFAELSDAVADLEANMMHFQLMHESLARFGESFASFLYGLNMNAFCVDFPEQPISESFRRAGANKDQTVRSRSTERFPSDGDTTFMTTDMSFVENPSTAPKPTSNMYTASETRPSRLAAPSRGGVESNGRRTEGRARPSGLMRPRARGLR